MYVEDKEKFVGVPLKAARAEPFSLESLIAWLETRDPEETYNYMDSSDCLLRRYANSIGTAYRIELTPDDNPKTARQKVEAVGFIEPYTMGAALSRARSYAEAGE